MRRLLLTMNACCLAAVGAVFAGPVWSGAIFLLLPAGYESVPHTLPEGYVSLHKGGIDPSTGLYVRQDEDLVVTGTPPLFLRRTYLSRYHVSREFGVGTTHDGEWYLIGDGERFQWAALIRADGSRISFRRISPGSSVLNALYAHDTTPTEYDGARLGWTGWNWALRLRNGGLLTFRGCGADGSLCSLLEGRDWDGHVTRYARDPSGRLLRIEAGDRWIAFDYDDRHRITRAHDSSQHEVWYAYDSGGRLERVRGWDGSLRRYGYTDRDEMATISEPEMSIVNTYDAGGRVIRQVNTFPGEEDSLTWDFAYRMEGDAIVATDITRSDGIWTTYTYSPTSRYPLTETWRYGDSPQASFSYTRDPVSRAVTAITVTCEDRMGRPIQHSSLVRPGEEERVKVDLLQTGCAWSGWRRRT